MPVLLSINIPTYNRSRFLDQLLQSLAQNDPGVTELIEVNVLDNASSDDTAAVIQTYQQRLRLHYQRHAENLGPMANIHLAHRAGTGRYVWVVGDDDYLKPGQLERITRLLMQSPAAVLLSYSKRTPEGQELGDVTLGTADCMLRRQSPGFSVAQVDPLIGFLTANITDRDWVDRFDAARYEELDARGELAHATMVYAAIASGQPVGYLSGAPVVQTMDNGQLRHAYWIHVCVRYCMTLPDELVRLGFDSASTRRYFRKRLLRECVRRLLAEKYRRHDASVVVRDPVVREALGRRVALLSVLDLIPGFLIRGVHDLVRTRRR